MPEVHFYLTNPPDTEGVPTLGDALRKLNYVSEVEVDTSGSVVAVLFEGGRDEQQEIERAIEETGYEISRLSVKTE